MRYFAEGAWYPTALLHSQSVVWEAMDGAQTASGETYRNDALTAAHRTLEFGTRVQVTNLDDAKSVEVVINDRGATAEGVIIDVSYSAAHAPDMLDPGIVQVKIEVID
jgi:rare lipoprotein A